MSIIIDNKQSCITGFNTNNYKEDNNYNYNLYYKIIVTNLTMGNFSYCMVYTRKLVLL